jgi:hypothetical protein
LRVFQKAVSAVPVFDFAIANNDAFDGNNLNLLNDDVGKETHTKQLLS